MTGYNEKNRFYYSAPQLPQPADNPFFDPFMEDIPALDDKEALRPGDIFRAPDGTSSTVGNRNFSKKDSYAPKSGKLSWTNNSLLK